MRVYTCSREIDAMLTCIYEAWGSGLGHRNVRLALEPVGQCNLMEEYVHVEADYRKAQKVIDSTCRKISLYFYQEMLGCLHYYEEDVLDNVYRMMILGFHYGASALDMLQYEAVTRNMIIRRAYGKEVNRFQEVLRFHLVHRGIYVAHIEPHSRVCVSLGSIFQDRMPSENWMIVDDVHQEAVVHEKNAPFYMRYLSKEEYDRLLETEKENDEYTDLWQVFFDSIGIEERKNPTCQRTLLPYWTREHMVEFQHDRS